MRKRGTVYTTSWLVVCFWLIFAWRAPDVIAGCNLVPARDQTFISLLGSVSTPTAGPGQTVTILATSEVFAQNPAQNSVELTFSPIDGGPVTTISGIIPQAPTPNSECEPAQCVGGLCTCVIFLFPDTDAQVGGAADGTTLTGPVTITVETGGAITAVIGSLFEPNGVQGHALFPSFTALPPMNDFSALAAAPGSAQGASDEDGNLLIPIDYASLLPPLGGNVTVQAQIIEAEIPGLAAIGSTMMDVFSPDGRRLPPLLRRVDATHLVGTVDAPAAVLRIAGAVPDAGLTQLDDKGPIVIPGVDATADPRKRGDDVTMRVGESFAVFENRECGPLDAPGSCLDLNNDNDQDDYFLVAVDLTVPDAPFVVIDEIDGSELPNHCEVIDPCLPFCAPTVYQFDTSDSGVAFRIGEPGPFVDRDGDCSLIQLAACLFGGSCAGICDAGELLRSGAFDLTRSSRVVEADGAPRVEVGGSLITFTQPDAMMRDRVFAYDTASASPSPELLSDATHSEFYVSRFPFVGQTLNPRLPFDISAGDGFIGFTADEGVHGVDLNGVTGTQHALFAWDSSTNVDAVVNLQRQTLTGIAVDDGFIAYSEFSTNNGQASGLRATTGVFELPGLASPPTLLCDQTLGTSLVMASHSSSIVPCANLESGGIPGGEQDFNGDGDMNDIVLSVFLPELATGAEERALALAIPDQFSVQIKNDAAIFAVDESAQGVDLDGDGIVGDTGSKGEPVSVFVLHTLHGLTGRLINTGIRVIASFDPILQFIDRGASVIGDNLRTILRDIDEDGHFEEVYTDPFTGEAVFGDNCPSTSNPLQEDIDGDGLGDACDTPCVRGDCNVSESLDAGDPICTALCLVGDAAPAFDCVCAADCNCVGGLEAADPVCSVLRLVGQFDDQSCVANLSASTIVADDDVRVRTTIGRETARKVGGGFKRAVRLRGPDAVGVAGVGFRLAFRPDDGVDLRLSRRLKRLGFSMLLNFDASKSGVVAQITPPVRFPIAGIGRGKIAIVASERRSNGMRPLAVQIASKEGLPVYPRN